MTSKDSKSIKNSCIKEPKRKYTAKESENPKSKVVEIEARHLVAAAAAVGGLFVLFGILLGISSHSVTKFLTDEMNFTAWDI